MSHSDSLDATEKETTYERESDQIPSKSAEMTVEKEISREAVSENGDQIPSKSAETTVEKEISREAVSENGDQISSKSAEMTVEKEISGEAVSERSENILKTEISSEKESIVGVKEGNETFEKPFNEASMPKDYEEFLKKYGEMTSPEGKLQYTIEFMEYSLSQSGCPNFKNFWESRKFCLELFKENLPASARSTFWSKYRDLSKEARNLKALLDEQSAFAIEQIEMAIGALEEDVSQLEALLGQLPPALDTVHCRVMKKHFDYYNAIQRELNLLNAQAARINGLRKELIKTEMRVRFKNKFFQRLSSAGDKVFPRRKELIKEVSHRFNQDVELFVDQHFGDETKIGSHLYDIRDEIKSLQGLAKLLTLNTQSFNQTRLKLSNCWDKIKRVEKERKKIRAEKKGVFQANATAVRKKLDPINEAFKAGEITVDKAQKAVSEISSYMRSIELGKEEVVELRGELQALQKSIYQKENEAENEKRQKELEKEQQRQAQVQQIKDDIDKLLTNVEDYDIEQIMAKRDELWQQLQDALLTKFERQNLERLLKPIKDIIAEKKEQALCNLSDDEKKMMEYLKDLLAERIERCKEIKKQIEEFRKAQGSSVSDFQKAMSYNQQLSAEKERLEKVNQGILEIQHKIATLEEKHK